VAAVTALRLRNEGGPALCGQLLLHPVTDYHTPAAEGHEDQFPPPRLSAGCGFRKEPFAGAHSNGRDAPIPAVR
jgi:acetyl esterase/lipase